MLLLDHAPNADEIRRIQAQENQREDLTLTDQQAQFADCWAARAGLRESDRIAAVCADLGIGPVKAHNLRRQLTLPEPIRTRVAERPGPRQLSATLANRLADMHDVAPQLTGAVAQRISTPELHDAALRDLGAFVHRTLVEDETAYAVRIDDGALLDAHAQLALARAQLDERGRQDAAAALGCPLDELDETLDGLDGQAKSRHVMLRVDATLRERARTGRYAYVHERGPDFAAGIWVVDPAFMIDAIRQCVDEHAETPVASDPAFFAGAGLDAADLREAAQDERERRHEQRQRQADATRTNLGLGHDLRAGLIDPSPAQLDALRALVCRLLARDYRDVIAYGAGWTDPERQRPVGETARHEPIADRRDRRRRTRTRAREPDPLRGIAALVARCAAAFVLDPDGVTRTKVLGSERIDKHEVRRVRHVALREEHLARLQVPPLDAWSSRLQQLWVGRAHQVGDHRRDLAAIDGAPRLLRDLLATSGCSSSHCSNSDRRCRLPRPHHRRNVVDLRPPTTTVTSPMI